MMKGPEHTVIVLLMLFLAACSKDTVPAGEPREGEIRFSSASVTASQTKSAVAVVPAHTDSLRTNGFNIAGIWKGDTEYLNGTASYDSFLHQFVLDETRYWPLDGAMDFYAVYPKNTAIDTADPASPCITFAADGETDLITSKATIPNRKVADLSFVHSLALVTVECRGESGASLNYKVRKIQAVTRASAGFDFTSWSDYSDSTKVIDIFDGEGVTVSSGQDFTPTGTSVTVFPTDLTLRVTYDIYCGDILIQSRTAETAVPEQHFPVMGHLNTYRCTLQNLAPQILFTVSVDDWLSGSYDIIL